MNVSTCGSLTAVSTLNTLTKLCNGPVQIAINSWKDHFADIEHFLLDAMIQKVDIDPNKERMMVHHNTVVEVYFKLHTNGNLVGVLHYDVDLAIEQALLIAMNKRNARHG